MTAVVVPFEAKRKSSVPTVPTTDRPIDNPSPSGPAPRPPGPLDRMARRAIAAVGGDPEVSLGSLAAGAAMTVGLVVLLVVVPAAISNWTGWEPKRWQIAAIALLGLINFAPIAVSLKRLIWPAKARRRRPRA